MTIFFRIFVRLGDLNIQNQLDGLSGVDISVIKFIKHEQYSRFSKQNDIALAKLERNVKFSDLVRPACLWQDDRLNVDSVVATGWGTTEFGANQNSDDLLKVSLDILDIDHCSQFFGRRDDDIIINRNQICAGVLTGGHDTCQGGDFEAISGSTFSFNSTISHFSDSGGPIQIVLPDHKCTYHIVGLTSFGGVCGEANSPSVYTRVSSYITWIEEKVWG